MLTKEECLEALNEIYSLAIPCREEVYEHRSNYLKQRYDLIKELIDEYFDNPPLKFEELKEGMLVFDIKRKSWIEIDKTWEGIKQFVVCWIIGWDLQQTFEYEPNRFYRKEVQE